MRVGGAKNAALPILAATILVPGEHRVRNVPRLRDVDTMARLLEILGAKVERRGDEMVVETGALSGEEAPYDLVKTMRASVLVLGPLLARAGQARVSLPGGCAIGERPVNLHLAAMRALGAEIAIEHGYITARSGQAARRAHPLREADRHRHRERADGGRARRGHDRDHQRRLRAGDRGPRPGARRHGRAHLRRRDRDDRRSRASSGCGRSTTR